MQAEEYLKKIRRLNSFAKLKQEELEELRERIASVGSIDYTADRVQSSPSPDKIVNAVIKLTDAEDRYKKALDELYTLKAEAEQRVETIENDKYRLVLMLRYFRFMTFEAIAEEMGFSNQWVQTLHERALLQFEKKFFTNFSTVD